MVAVKDCERIIRVLVRALSTATHRTWTTPVADALHNEFQDAADLDAADRYFGEQTFADWMGAEQ